MTPSPDQIRQAARNTRQPVRTHHARVRDAMDHVRLSQTRQSPLARASSDIRQMTSQVATHE